MKRAVMLALASCLLAAPSLSPALFAQALGGDRFEAGIFTDYFGLQRTTPNINYLGLGARAAFTGCDVSAGMLAEAGKRWPASLGPAPALVAQDGARTPFADHQFDIVTISAVLHHVPVAERAAVYRELGRVLKPGGRIYVFEHNPRNPLVRYVIARTPIDENAILLDEAEVRHGLLDSAHYDIASDYLMFMPPGIIFLGWLDRLLAWLPLGAQYVVAARKSA